MTLRRTHFEQVPVELAKKIAEEEARLEAERVRQENNRGERSDGTETTGARDAATASPHSGNGNEERTSASLQGINDSLKYPEWQQPLLDALLQLDHEELKIRLNLAETAITNRMQTISRDAAYRAERQAIEDAFATLRVLKRDSSRVSG